MDKKTVKNSTWLRQLSMAIYLSPQNLPSTMAQSNYAISVSCDKIAGEIERQEQYAELGRLAAKIVESGAYLAINTYNSCHPEADAYTECECRKNCPWNEFCKLRAEMEGGNGSE